MTINIDTPVLDNYLEISRSYNLPERSVRWYARHVEDYLEVVERKELSQHQPSDVEEFLRAKGRRPLITDWEFEQIVDALRVFFLDVVQPGWARSFDWDSWRASSNSLQGAYEFIEQTTPHTCTLSVINSDLQTLSGRM